MNRASTWPRAQGQRGRGPWAAGLIGLLAATTLTGVAGAQDTPDYFRQYCISCHTIGGGRLNGPDLKDVTKRQERAWLVNFMMDPRGVIDSGDPYARKIFEEAGENYMSAIYGMTRERAEKLLDLIEAESQLEESQFKGLQISTAPFTDADRQRGKAIFLGTQPLEHGGPACISCHSMHDLSPLGGGRLGIDLTNVYERLEGRVKLSSWLVAPATETMLPVFEKHRLTEDEIHALVAYFESTAAERPSSASANQVAFFLLGLAGAAIFVFAFDTIWKRRFHAVRRPLVESLQARGKP